MPIMAGVHAVGMMTAFLRNFPNLAMLPVDFAVAEQAAYLRAQAQLKLPDATIVATGLVHRCQAIICNDNKWARLSAAYPAVSWIYLDAYR